MVTLKAAKYRLKSFVLRLGLNYAGRADWNDAHRRYLARVVRPTPAQHVVWSAQRSPSADGTAQRCVRRGC